MGRGGGTRGEVPISLFFSFFFRNNFFFSFFFFFCPRSIPHARAMRAFQKSLKAGQEKMTAAMNAAVSAASDLNNSLPPRYKIPGGGSGGIGGFQRTTRSPPGGADVDGSHPTRSYRGGDDDGDSAAEPGTHLLIRVEFAEGLDTQSVFVALRVAGTFGELKGVRAHTLVARAAASQHNHGNHQYLSNNNNNDDDGSGGGGGGDGGGGGGIDGLNRTVWRAVRDLRCRPRSGDVLLVEVYSGWDVKSGWDRCVARGMVSMAALPRGGPNGTSITIPLHRRLERRGCAGSGGTAGGTGINGEMSLTISRVGNVDAVNEGGEMGERSEMAEGGDPATTIPRRRKRIFFVRHGESAWNEAQREMQLAKMMRFDHPLNARGVQQAQHLAARSAHVVAALEEKIIRSTGMRTGTGTGLVEEASASPVGSDLGVALAAGSSLHGGGGGGPEGGGEMMLSSPRSLSPVSPRSLDGDSDGGDGGMTRCGGGESDVDYDDWVRSYAGAGRCFTSPLTRAVQTAAIVATQHPSGLGGGGVVFLRSAREIKATVGGLDTVGIEQGKGILDRSAAKLIEVMPAAAAAALMERFIPDVDVNDAVGHWWTSQDDVDTPAELHERMDDFFESMRFDPCDVVVVVGHSLFLQQMLRRFMSPELSSAAPELARSLKESKLQNCGCLGLDVSFEAETGTPSIVNAKFMFKTRTLSKY